MIKSETLELLAAALVKAQAKLKPAPMDRKNTFFGSKYATLASVIETIREPFAANGLTFTQMPRTEGDMVYVQTVFLHTSGQYLGSEVGARPTKTDPQAYGSAITYLKRYGLQAMAGISSADEDDDGNHASTPPASPPAPATKPNEAIYHKTNKAERALLDTFLKKQKIDPQFWNTISDVMDGRNKGEIDEVIAGIV